MYTKEKNEVVGRGYHCFSTAIKYKFTKTLFLYSIEHHEERAVTLTEAECRKMVETKRCGIEQNKMSCEGNHCWYTEKVTPSYNWLMTNEYSTTTCKFSNMTITAEHADSYLFGARCKANELFCRLHSSVIVWSQRNIHSCPFRRIIKQTKFKIESNGFTSKELNLNFIFDRVEKQCKHQLIKTVEGVFVKFSNFHDDRFYAKIDKNKETVAYNGFIYKPQCSMINYLRFKKSNNNCFDNLQVEISNGLDGAFRKATLNPSGILTKQTILRSKAVEGCKAYRQIYKISEHMAIVKEDNYARITELSELKTDDFQFASLNIEYPVNHTDVLEEELDLNTLFVPQEDNDDLLTDHFTSDYHTVSKVKGMLVEFSTKAINVILILTGLFIFVLLSICFIYMFVKYNMIYRIIKKFQKKDKKKEYELAPTTEYPKSDYSIIYDWNKIQEEKNQRSVEKQ